MNNARSERSERQMNEMQDAARKNIDQASRATRAATEGVAQVALAGTDLLLGPSKTMQMAWESSGKLMSELTEQSIQRFSRLFGVGGDNVEQGASLSARNLEQIAHSGQLLSQGMQQATREIFEFTRGRIQENLDHVDTLLSCRTPHDLLAAQSSLVRDNLNGLVQSTRRVAEISLQTADEAARTLSESIPREA